MRKTLVVYKGHNYVRLTDFKPELEKQILRPFCARNFYQIGKEPTGMPGKFKWVVSHVFAQFNQDKTELRFNKEALPDLLSFMKSHGYSESRIKILDERVIKGKKVDLKFVSDQIKPRNESQQEYCDFLSDLSKPVSVNNMTTGGGKTFTALWASVQIGERVLITVLPRFIDIWVKSISEFIDIKPNDLFICDSVGIPELHKAITGKIIDPKIIILPLTKIDVYAKKLKTEEGAELPSLDKVFNDFRCGVRIIDEAHESIYSVYMSLLHGNHQKTIALSATLKGDDEFINKIYNQIFPLSCYLKPPEYVKYIHVIAYQHRMDTYKYKINVKGFGGYSHVKFEQGILKNKYVFEKMYQMYKEAFIEYYLNEYREGQKFMWFFATINFCEEFLKRFKMDYPDMDVICFNSLTSNKPETKEEYRKHRGVITTPGSCGTGKDIEKLFIVFSPISVSSTQRNDQMVGRTRPIDKWWPDLDPIFLYFVCPDIPKQVDYHRKRRIIFDKKAKDYTLINSNVRI